MTDIIDVQQIIYALERAEWRLRREADELGRRLDYNAEFFAEDADRMLEAIALLGARPVELLKRALPSVDACCPTQTALVPPPPNDGDIPQLRKDIRAAISACSSTAAPAARVVLTAPPDVPSVPDEPRA